MRASAVRVVRSAGAVALLRITSWLEPPGVREEALRALAVIRVTYMSQITSRW
jgi:hypothetical protein